MQLMDLKKQGIDIQENIPLSRFTFTKTGGPAQYLAFPKNLNELELLVDTIKENNLINKGDVIVVGVSGGPDSITLLVCLNKYKDYLGIRIICAHINHLIRKDSTEDEQFVENICKNVGVKCYVKRAEVEKIAKKQKKGTEEIGRQIRYDFFDEVAKKENANKIAIAHNMNDNAETMLLNIIRGSGLIGLEGIQAKEYGKYIRPLINCKREEIEEYCAKNNLQPRIDSTNKENIYRRNIIRNKLLPQLQELNPNIVESLSNLSKIIKVQNMHIKNEVENIYRKIGTETINKEIETKLISTEMVKEAFETKIEEETLDKKVEKKAYNKNNSENSLQKINKVQKTKSKEKVGDLGKVELDLPEFQKLDLSIQQNLILYTINKVLGSARNVEKINIDDIIKMCKRNVGNKYIYPNKNLKILVKNKKIIFIPLT